MNRTHPLIIEGIQVTNADGSIMFNTVNQILDGRIPFPIDLKDLLALGTSISLERTAFLNVHPIVVRGIQITNQNGERVI